MLFFWTGGNRDQIDRLFRTSALMRPKWDRRLKSTTYGWWTIDGAIAEEMKWAPAWLYAR
jgi:putative DNA primase/helicase